MSPEAHKLLIRICERKGAAEREPFAASDVAEKEDMEILNELFFQRIIEVDSFPWEFCLRLTKDWRERMTGRLMKTTDNIEDGFGIAWMAQAFRMNEQTVRARLKNCTPKRREGRGYKYDLAEAAPYLTKPNINWDIHMKNLRKTDLPPHLQKDIWDAKLKETAVSYRGRRLVAHQRHHRRIDSDIPVIQVQRPAMAGCR